MRLNQGEYGQPLYANMRQDIATATNLEFILQPRIGESIEADSNIVIGVDDLVVGDQKLIANEYLIYTIQECDLDKTGIYRTQGIVMLNGAKIKSDFTRVTVLD